MAVIRLAQLTSVVQGGWIDGAGPINQVTSHAIHWRRDRVRGRVHGRRRRKNGSDLKGRCVGKASLTAEAGDEMCRGWLRVGDATRRAIRGELRSRSHAAEPRVRAAATSRSVAAFRCGRKL